MLRATRRGDPATPRAQACLPHVPLLLQTKQRHWVQSRRACIASGCGASGETSSRREKRTEGLKTIPVSKVTLCHANSPGANPIPRRVRGGHAGPAGPPWAHPLLPIAGAGPGAAQGAGVPQPCSPVSTVHAGWRLRPSRNSPCSLPPLQKTSYVGHLPPTWLSGAEGGGKHSGTTQSAWWGGPGHREEGTSSVNVTRMQTPVSQERRGCSLPESPAAAGSQAEASTGPASHAASRCLWGALFSSRTSKNYFKPNPCKAAICLCVSAAARRPGSRVPLLFGEGEKKKYIYIFIRRGPRCVCSPPQPHLSASMVTLAFCSAVACWETAAGQPAGCAGGAGVHMLCCWPGGEAAGQVGLKAPCWGSGGAGGGGEVAIEATGLLLLKLSEAFRRENMVRASGKLGGVAGVLAGVHICGKETGGQVCGGGVLHLLPPTRVQHKTPLPLLLQHTELPDPRSADNAACKQRLFKALKTNAVG